MKPSNYGPFYAAGLYPKIATICRQYGYALAVHGSVANDFDLIAVPWVQNVASPDEVIAHLLKRFAFKKDIALPTFCPHGRVSYKIHLSFDTCSFDISFVARQP